MSSQFDAKAQLPWGTCVSSGTSDTSCSPSQLPGAQAILGGVSAHGLPSTPVYSLAMGGISVHLESAREVASSGEIVLRQHT